MKTSIKAFAILALTSLSPLMARTNFVSCDSILGTDHSVTLLIINNELKQIRTNTMPSKAFIPMKLSIQNIEGSTVYSIAGVAGLVELEKSVLSDNGGRLKMADDEFSCF